MHVRRIENHAIQPPEPYGRSRQSTPSSRSVARRRYLSGGICRPKDALAKGNVCNNAARCNVEIKDRSLLVLYALKTRSLVGKPLRTTRFPVGVNSLFQARLMLSPSNVVCGTHSRTQLHEGSGKGRRRISAMVPDDAPRSAARIYGHGIRPSSDGVGIPAGACAQHPSVVRVSITVVRRDGWMDRLGAPGACREIARQRLTRRGR